MLLTPDPPRITLPKLWEKTDDSLTFSFHPGQVRAWESLARFVFILAGTQSGKTSWGPWWLAREIGMTADEQGGANDYIAVTATYDLFNLKMLPEMLNTFEHVTRAGRYWSGNKVIELRDPRTERFWAKRADNPMWGRIILRSASSPGGVESATARAAWADECGQPDFGLATWEALLRRLSLSEGRVLGTTTLYDIDWLKTEVWDRYQRIGQPGEQPGDRDFEVINFDSTENPVFPEAEFIRAKGSMPGWRFDMFYRGIFTRPAGQIYDCFLDADVSAGGHKMRPRPLPESWHRVAGLDFGVVNTCAGLYAVEEDAEGYPTGRLLLYRTYHAGSRNATEHVAKLREIEPDLSLVFGGAASEDQWLRAYLWAGMPVYAPAVTDVEVGIDGVYGATKAGQVVVFDTETTYIQKKKDYSRELDDQGNPTVKIKDKEKYHWLDQERYLVPALCPQGQSFLPFNPRIDLIVGAAADVEPPAYQTRFGGLYYQDGAPSAFVLCVVNTKGEVVADQEITLPGLSVDEFVREVVATVQAIPRIHPDQPINLRSVTILANDDLFLPIKKGELSGPPIAEAFWNAGLNIVKAGGDGVNEWAVMSDWLTFGKLKINRKFCPFLALTLPILIADAKEPSKPDARNPISAAAALCNALMSRPRPSKDPNAPKPRDPRNPFADQTHLPHALRSEPRQERKE